MNAPRTLPTNETSARLKQRAARRRREIALLGLSLALVVAALLLGEPFLILAGLFPALASYGQR
jgi:type II secretory pathway component PulM